MLAHAVLLDAIQARHTGPRWTFGSRTPDQQLTGPAVIAWPLTMTRQPNARRSLIVSDVELWIVTHHADEAKADQALDALVVELIGHLEALPMVAWTTLERGALADRYHGWRAVVTLAHTIEGTTP